MTPARRFSYVYCLVCLPAAMASAVAFLLSLPAVPIAYGLMRRHKAAWWALNLHALLVFGFGLIHATPAGLAMGIIALAFAITCLRHDLRPTHPFSRYRVFPPTSVRLRVRIGDALGHTIAISERYMHLSIEPSLFSVGQQVSIELLGSGGRTVRLAGHIVPSDRRMSPAVAVRLTAMSTLLLGSVNELIHTNRRHARVKIQMPMLIEHRDALIEGTTYDLSIGGCYIACSPVPAGLGEKIALALKLDESVTLRLSGEIVWQREIASHGKPAGVAIKFIALSAEDGARLSEALERHENAQAA